MQALRYERPSNGERERRRRAANRPNNPVVLDQNIANAAIEALALMRAAGACLTEQDCAHEPWCRINGRCYRAPEARAEGSSRAVGDVDYNEGTP